MKINISCVAKKVVPLESLENFQFDLKKLSKTAYEKMKKSILKHGFSFPVFVWKKYILDGHQRIFVLKGLLKEGYSIEGIPVVEIEAKTKKEAAEKLLVASSGFGHVTEDGFFNFINNYSIDFDGLGDELEIHNVDFDEFMERREDTALKDVEKDVKGDEKKKRDIGKNKQRITAVLFSEDIHVFEQALISTGDLNRSRALIQICKFYLDENKGKNDFFV